MKLRPARLGVLRALDLAVIVVTAAVWLPVIAVCSATIRVTSGRPVFFRQARIGLDERTFSVVKFRSMKVGDNSLIPDPSQTTAAGRFLRKWSLDELPQIANVVRGEMSLVGPRPMLPQQSSFVPSHANCRHSVRPGITGLAQINGRNSITWEERFVFDAEWAANPSPVTYLKILARTLRVVLTRDGVAGHDPSDPFVIDLATTPDLRESSSPSQDQQNAL